MAKEIKRVTKGGYAILVSKGSRSQEILFSQGHQIVAVQVAFRLGWFKPMRCGSHNETIYGFEYGENREKYLRF